MGERGMQIAADTNLREWEDAEFPILCETCLGDNPYVRMTKERAGKSCKICERPYTAFRWRPGTNARFKSTQLCQTCAKVKNVCQTCVLDLQYGLPVEVRDRFLAEEDRVTVPQSDANREWQQQQQIRKLEAGDNPYEQKVPNQKLLRMARAAPYYRRNMPHKCSFYAKGECNRGAKCPFMHEMPSDKADPLSNQNITDRFYGKSDPVAAKLLHKMENQPELVIPEDPTVCTLWVGGLENAAVTQDDIKDAFYHYGEIKMIRFIPVKGIAFVEFTTREAAEAAALGTYKTLVIKNRSARVNWATAFESKGGEESSRRGDGGGGGNARGQSGEKGGEEENETESSQQKSSESAQARSAPPPPPPVVSLPPPPGMPMGMPVPMFQLPLHAYQPPPMPSYAAYAQYARPGPGPGPPGGRGFAPPMGQYPSMNPTRMGSAPTATQSKP